MVTSLILAASLTGQVCAHGIYRQAAVTQSYTIPLAYQPTYAAAANYNAYTTNYVPVVYADYYSIVGGQQRTYDRRIEALKAQADIALRLDKIANSLAGLNTLAVNPPAVQAAPIAPDVPGKPLPPVPAKPSPQSPEQPSLPPTPKVNPDDGSVPPPPPTPNPPGGVSMSAETSAVLTSKCAKCHSAAAAPKSGGEFAMFADDGSVRTNLTGVEMLRILQQVETGKMPKKAIPLSAEERAFIRADVFGSKAVETALAQ